MTERFRDRTTDIAIPLSYTNTGNSTHNASNSLVGSKYESFTDVVTPNFFKLKKAGLLLPINEMTSYKRSFQCDTRTIEWTRTRISTGALQWKCTWDGMLPLALIYKANPSRLTPGQNPYVIWPISNVSPTWPSESTVLTSALANARTKGMDLLTWAAELEKTLSMVKNLQKNIFRRAQLVQKQVSRNKIPVDSVLEVFSQTWLEARYGWRILMYDIEAVDLQLLKLRTLASKLVRGYALETASAERTVYTVTKQPIRSYTYGSSVNATYDCSAVDGLITQTRSRVVRAGSFIDSVAEGLVFADPINTAWELIPFSFIVDWFASVGETIQAYSPTAVGRHRASFVTKREIVTTEVILTPVVGGNSLYANTPDSLEPMLLTASEETVTRVPADPSLTLPTLRLNLDGAKVTDLVALFFTRYLGLVKELTKAARL